MLPISHGVAQNQAVAVAAFALSVADNSPAPEIVFPAAGTSEDGSTGAPEIVFTATASGGSGSYTYTWLLVLLDTGGGCFSIGSQGTTDLVDYDDATVTAGTSIGAPGTILIRCTASDGVATPIVVENTMNCIPLY